jgi:putative flippase GtrA
VEFIRTLLRLQLFKFILAGAICAVLEFLTFNIFIEFVKLNYLIANMISIVFAVSINYIISRMYVFEKSRYSKRDEFLSFVFFSVLALMLNQAILWIFVEIFKFDLSLCKALAIAIVAFFSYVTKKYIVFKA